MGSALKRASDAESDAPRVVRPRYTRGLLWGEHERDDHSYVVSASYNVSLVSEPLPRPPPPHFFHPQLLETVHKFPSLFKIVTPIKVDALMHALDDHPNRPFVDSLCTAFTEGFWPWANFDKQRYPHTQDASDDMPSNPRFADFVRAHRDTELEAGRFSESFGPDLLPGMYAMPQHVVEQHGKCRLITNQSFGNYSLNSMIPNDERSLKIDGIRSLATLIIKLRRIHGPGVPLVIFKSDASKAYRRLPMHPLWQLFQALRIDGEYYIDRNNVFGGAASGRMWTLFLAAVIWIAEKRGITDLRAYIDDVFSVQLGLHFSRYEPYDVSFPERQTRLLLLWDELGVLHELPKQLFGEQLLVIGFQMDTVAMTMSMSLEARDELCDAITVFCSVVDLRRGQNRRSVLEFQRMIGRINWALNVFPLLRPGLTLAYDKIADKPNPRTKCYITEPVVRDLHWIRDNIAASDGIFLLEAIAWAEDDPTAMVIHTDASLSGLGFWVAADNLGFYADAPRSKPVDTIFYLEALVVLCAVRWAIRRGKVSRLLIYSDNYNTVNAFNSFAAKKGYYPILLEAAELLIENKIDLRVVHKPGHENQIADMLSRHDLDQLLVQFAGIQLHSFQPSLPGRAGHE